MKRLLLVTAIACSTQIFSMNDFRSLVRLGTRAGQRSNAQLLARAHTAYSARSFSSQPNSDSHKTGPNSDIADKKLQERLKSLNDQIFKSGLRTLGNGTAALTAAGPWAGAGFGAYIGADMGKDAMDHMQDLRVAMKSRRKVLVDIEQRDEQKS